MMYSKIMNQLFIPILLGTAREGRKSEAAATYVLEQAKAYNKFETQLLDVRDFITVPKTARGASDEKSKEWSGIMKKADGLIIVAPEYNHGYSGELKLMLDELYDEYNRKPIALCGTGGILGGGREVEQLRLVAIELQMVPMRNAVYFMSVYNLFDEQGRIKDDSYAERLRPMFDELVWYAQALKTAREQTTSM